jgi:uncharacterized RDD family membrane protein YckC
VVPGWFAYLIVAGAAHRTTLGKRVVRITVLRHDWTPITAGQAVLRHLTHLVPIVALAGAGLALTTGHLVVYGIGSIFMVTSEVRRRLGDRVADTMVARRTAQAWGLFTVQGR